MPSLYAIHVKLVFKPFTVHLSLSNLLIYLYLGVLFLGERFS